MDFPKSNIVFLHIQYVYAYSKDSKIAGPHQRLNIELFPVGIGPYTHEHIY